MAENLIDIDALASVVLLIIDLYQEYPDASRSELADELGRLVPPVSHIALSLVDLTLDRILPSVKK